MSIPHRSWGDLQYFMITSTATKLAGRNKCYIATFFIISYGMILLFLCYA